MWGWQNIVSESVSHCGLWLSSHSHEGVPILTGEWKLALGCTMSRNTRIYCWTFPWMVWHATTLGLWDTAHHPYISTCFCGKPFSSYYTFVGCKLVYNQTPPSLLHRQHYCTVCGCETATTHCAICFCDQEFLEISQINKTHRQFYCEHLYSNTMYFIMHHIIVSWKSSECLRKLFKTWFRSCSPAILWFQCDRSSTVYN